MKNVKFSIVVRDSGVDVDIEGKTTELAAAIMCALDSDPKLISVLELAIDVFTAKHLSPQA